MAKETDSINQEQRPRPCPQNCALCSQQQQIYCASKMLFDLSRLYQELRQQIAGIESAVAHIQEQTSPAGGDGQLSVPFIESD